jgi:hypothetical protein
VHRKSHIRGAFTTGIKWYFIIVNLNADGAGAKYWISELIEWKTKRRPASKERLVEGTSDESDPALIAGILSSWVSMFDHVVSSTESKKKANIHCCQIPESFAQFNGDQWFVQQPGGGGIDNDEAGDDYNAASPEA